MGWPPQIQVAGSDTARHLALVLQAALQRLAFQNVGASIKACQAIAELLVHSQDLRQLHLANNMSDDEVGAGGRGGH